MLVVSVDGQSLFSPCWCGGTDFVGHGLLDYNSCRIIRCKRCGQMRTFPEPSPNDARRIYSDENEKYSMDGLNRAARKATWTRIARRILDATRPYLKCSESPSVLDVGCGYGDFLFVARAAGWDADGIEVNTANAGYLQECDFRIFTAPIEQAPVEANRYDLVVCNHILEHIAEPNAFLQRIRYTLKPGGVLFIGAPIFWSPIPILLKRSRWYALVPEEHVWQFSSSSLLRLISANSFTIRTVQRGMSGFEGRFSAHPKDALRWTIYSAIRLVRQGDMVELIATNDA